MQTKREWLAGQGLAKMGRGKFSNDAKAALAKAEAGGMKFSDSTGPVSSTPKAGKVVKDKPQPSGDTLYVSPTDFRYSEDEWVAVDAKGGKYSMRECCNTCKVSLTNHGCDNPSVYNNITVKIVRK